MSFFAVPPLIPADANFATVSASVVDLNHTNIINLADPIEPQDATNKEYVDNAVTTQSLPSGGTTSQVLTKNTSLPPYNAEWKDVAAKSLVTSTGLVNVVSTAPTTGQTLVATGSSAATWQTVGGTPGGLNTQVQYNNAGAFGGNSGFTYNGTNEITVGDANDWFLNTKISGVFGDALGFFGISAYQNFAYLGSPTGENRFGYVDIYNLSNGIWNFVTRLTSGTQNSSFTQSVSGSSDGTTQLVAVGASEENANIGSVYIFQGVSGGLVSGNWTLVTDFSPSDNIGTSSFGSGVSLVVSGGVQTLVIGGPSDNGVGAAWIYQNTGSGWTEITKIIPSDNTGNSGFGNSVSLVVSGTTYTAIIGGPNDNSGLGAVWIYQNTGSGWTEVTKIIPSDNIGASSFGTSVGLTINGSTYTAVIGGPADNGNIGASWIYQNTGSGWTEVTKIIPSDYIGTGRIGFSVSIANQQGTTTVLISAPFENSSTGAVWIYQSIGSGPWTEVKKLVPLYKINPNIGTFGYTTSLYADGTGDYVALVGAYADGFGTNGAVWIYTNSSNTITLDSGNVNIPGILTSGVLQDGYGTIINGGNIVTNSLFVTTNLTLPLISSNRLTSNNFADVTSNFSIGSIVISNVTLTSGTGATLTVNNFFNPNPVLVFVIDNGGPGNAFVANSGSYSYSSGSFNITTVNVGPDVNGITIIISFISLA